MKKVVRTLQKGRKRNEVVQCSVSEAREDIQRTINLLSRGSDMCGYTPQDILFRKIKISMGGRGRGEIGSQSNINHRVIFKKNAKFGGRRILNLF
jgi:hypothetical protein